MSEFKVGDKVRIRLPGDYYGLMGMVTNVWSRDVFQCRVWLDGRGHHVGFNDKELELVPDITNEIGPYEYRSETNSVEFTVNAEGGKKQTGGKATFNQVPEAFVAALSKHMDIGAEKYGFGNWLLGLTESQALEASRRHIGKRRAGQNVDPETGSSHYLAMAANAMMAWCLEQEGKLKDDRAEFYVDFKKELK